MIPAMKSPIVSCAMVLTLSLGALSAVYADSATWNLNPISSDWNTAANWTPPPCQMDRATRPPLTFPRPRPFRRRSNPDLHRNKYQAIGEDPEKFKAFVNAGREKKRSASVRQPALR